MDIEGIIEGLSNKVPLENNSNDYIGKDGLLHCGKCHTAKQYRFKTMNIDRVVNCMCKCMAAEKEKERKLAEQREFERKIREYKKMGFPEKKMQECTFENASDSEVLNAMKKYADNFSKFKKDGKGLLLYGKVSVGKTYAAACVVNELINKGYPCLITNFDRIKNTLQGMFEGKQEYIDSLNKFVLFVLDDLGTERTTEFEQQMMFNIIDSRYRAGLPLIVTTNLSIEEMKNPKTIEQSRIYERVLEMCFPIEVKGVNKRRMNVIKDYEETKKLLGL